MGRVVGGAGRDGEVAVVGADDAEAAAADGVQVGAAGDEGNLVAGAGEEGAEVAADAAGAHNCDVHIRTFKPSIRACGQIPMVGNATTAWWRFDADWGVNSEAGTDESGGESARFRLAPE